MSSAKPLFCNLFVVGLTTVYEDADNLLRFSGNSNREILTLRGSRVNHLKPFLQPYQSHIRSSWYFGNHIDDHENQSFSRKRFPLSRYTAKRLMIIETEIISTAMQSFQMTSFSKVRNLHLMYSAFFKCFSRYYPLLI